MRSLELPFWLAGSYGSPEQVDRAVELGATGVQVGTAFAFCDESGMDQGIRRAVIRASKAGTCEVRTDPLASPAGFPFKVLTLKESLSEDSAFEARTKRCDLGFLRQAFERSDGAIGWRCRPNQNLRTYTKVGKRRKSTDASVLQWPDVGSRLGQVIADGSTELPIVTCGDEVKHIHQFLKSFDAEGYTARDVVERLLSKVAQSDRTTLLRSPIPLSLNASI